MKISTNKNNYSKSYTVNINAIVNLKMFEYIFIIIFHFLRILAAGNNLFSGVYRPNVNYGLEVYAGAWLMPRRLFEMRKVGINNINELEMTTTNVIVRNEEINEFGISQAANNVIMTRDYFDFFVEHLSSLTNQIRNPELAFPIYINMSYHKAAALKHYALKSSQNHAFQESVIALIPFSQGYPIVEINSAIRTNFFKMTFWSIYRFFSRIVVSVCHIEDYDVLMSLHLPVFDIYYTLEPDTAPIWHNSKSVLQFAMENLQHNSSWSSFQYIYFSEADTVMHLRNARELFHTLEQSLTNSDNQDVFILAPHRMQVRLVCYLVIATYLYTNLFKFIHNNLVM